MKSQRRVLDELEKMLVLAYRRQRDTEPKAGWRESVMGEIRHLEAFGSERSDQDVFFRFAWRFSAAAGIAALILLVYVFSSGIVDYQELAMRFLENPIDFII